MSMSIYGIFYFYNELIVNLFYLLQFFNNLLLHYAVNLDEHFKSSLSGCFSEEKSTVCLQNALMISDQHCPGHSASEPPDSGFM